LNDIIVPRLTESSPCSKLANRIWAARLTRHCPGEFFPQSQTANGSYTNGLRTNFFDQWAFSFNTACELRLLGPARLAIEGAEATLDASVFAYWDVTVTLCFLITREYLRHDPHHAETNPPLDISTIHSRRRPSTYREERLKCPSKGALSSTPRDQGKAS